MKLIKPSVQIIEQDTYDINSIFKTIELAGRTCYKSEDKITEDSAKEFVERMIKSGHGAMLEHGTVYLTIPTFYTQDVGILKYELNPYSKVVTRRDYTYITTNYRVLVEHEWLDDLKFLSVRNIVHKKRTTVKFICDRGVSHEFVRHRVFSFAQESTRYCNYSKDKFGNELTFIIPCWTNIHEGDYGDIFNPKESNITLTPNEYFFINSLRESEKYYMELTNNGWTPQQARNILPNSLKTELIMTGFNDDWLNFFKLRCASNAHPQAKELADILKKQFNF